MKSNTIIRPVVMLKKSRKKKCLRYFFQIMKWEPKNIHDSILPILILNWITGLNIFEYPLSKPRPGFTFIYVLLINCLYWIVAFSSASVNTNNITTIGRNIFVLIVYVNIFIAISSIIIGWYHYKAFKTNIQRLELLDEALESLGLPNQYRKIFISSMLKAVIWVIIICVLVYNDVSLLMTMFDWITSLNLLYLFHFPLHLNSVVDFTFTSIVNCLGMRFENINLLLRRTLPMYTQMKTVRELFPKYCRISALITSTEFSTIVTDRQKKMRLLVLVRYLHMELSKISWEINKIYQKQMMMKMGAHFIIITGLLYNLFTFIFFVNGTLKDKIRPIISITIWCIVYCYRFLNIHSTCARVSAEAHKTRGILYELKSSNKDKLLQEEIEEFALQLTQRPLAFAACGLSSLDYAFVERFIASVTTYLVLLIQFSPELRNYKKTNSFK